jgi:DNA-binding NarL/FixJ family response regulator
MTGPPPLRVVVADDAPLLRRGVRMVLETAGIDVVAEPGDAPGVVAAVRALHPDVAVVDIRMPPGAGDDGLRAAVALRREMPGLGVLLLSQYVEESYVHDLLADGVQGVGYLLKDRVADLDRFVSAVRDVAAGGSALDPEVVALLMGRQRAEGPLSALSPRERDVLELMAEGRSNGAIGRTLHLSESGVEKHIRHIFGKLELAGTPDDHRRVLAVLAYLDGAR